MRCELEVVGVGAGVRCFERGAGESAGHRCEFFLGRGLFSFGWGAHLVLALGYVDFSDWRLIVRIGDDFASELGRGGGRGSHLKASPEDEHASERNARNASRRVAMVPRSAP